MRSPGDAKTAEGQFIYLQHIKTASLHARRMQRKQKDASDDAQCCESATSKQLQAHVSHSTQSIGVSLNLTSILNENATHTPPTYNPIDMPIQHDAGVTNVGCSIQLCPRGCLVLAVHDDIALPDCEHLSTIDGQLSGVVGAMQSDLSKAGEGCVHCTNGQVATLYKDVVCLCVGEHTGHGVGLNGNQTSAMQQV